MMTDLKRKFVTLLQNVTKCYYFCIDNQQGNIFTKNVTQFGIGRKLFFVFNRQKKCYLCYLAKPLVYIRYILYYKSINYIILYTIYIGNIFGNIR